MAQNNKPSENGGIDESYFEEFAGEGLQTVTADDILIPRLKILQKGSPELDRQKAEYIKGAEIGEIINSQMGDVMGEEIEFIPVRFRKIWIEWYPRASQQGIANIHKDSSVLARTEQDDRKKPRLPNGNSVIETAVFYGFVRTGADLMIESFITMTSTQLRKAKKWLSLVKNERLTGANGRQFAPPLYYRSFVLGTAYEQNSFGNWYGWTVKRGKTLVELSKEIANFDVRNFIDCVQEYKSLLGSKDLMTPQLSQGESDSTDDDEVL